MKKRPQRRGSDGWVDVVAVGSIGLDDIETPHHRRRNLLGGSLSHACAAASFFARVGMVGIVGEDFPRAHEGLYRRFGIDLAGLLRVPGKTFRWSGVYEADMINRRTLLTELNVFAGFKPELPAAYRRAPFLLLGNIAPSLQTNVLSQVIRPRFVVADTMDLWIRTELKSLMEVIGAVDMLMLNDSEARLLAGHHNLKTCAEWIRRKGPRYLVIKKGEHGAMLFSPSGIFLVPAYPVDDVRDPTGAGDSFAGGFIGHLAASGGVADRAVKEALLAGSVVASFGVERFGVEALRGLRLAGIRRRLLALERMMRM